MGLTHLLTAEEVCDYFDVGIDTVRSWVARGDLSYVNLGTKKHRVMRFTEQAIEEFCSGKSNPMRIYQRSKSPYWQWRWTPPGSGKELRGSCRTTDREEAERYVIGLQADWRQAELLGQVPAITIDELFAKLVT
jgi:excisionase family DNA binding protein